MKIPKTLILTIGLTALATVAGAKIITVNTADNTDFSAGKTNLVTAIKLLADGDTMQFNIPGSGVQYINTPPDGYNLITANGVTIDGYSQPGAMPNSNPIHAPNNAQLKIVLSSTNGNALSMGIAVTNAAKFVYNNLGFGESEQAILGFFRATNVTVKGLAFLSAPTSTSFGVAGVVKSICFCADSQEVGGANCANWHVSGCWFGVDPATRQVAYMPDGVTVAMPTICIAAYRTRNNDGSNPRYPQPGTIGVAASSSNPRAESNVLVTGYGFDSEGLNFRISGNFFNVLPDGMHNFDPAQANGGNQQGDGDIEVGRVADNVVIGTDGDGVNDADEGNMFGGVNSPNWANTYLWSDNATNFVVAGNWYGVAVDGVTRFTNSSVVLHGVPGTAQLRFGSDFDGQSDALEGNVVFNNNPFATEFPSPNPSSAVPPFFTLSAGARVSLRGNELVNNNSVPFSYANGANGGAGGLANYFAPYIDATATNGNFPVLSTNSSQSHLIGYCGLGVAPYTNIVIDVYVADPEGWTNGQAFTFTELLDPNTGIFGGFSQGRTYLGSFADNGPLDRDPTPGEFDLDISALNLGSGFVTVTANYSADPPGTHNGRVQTSEFAVPIVVPYVPAGVASVGLTNIVPDVLLWYSSANYYTNGPVAGGAQVANLGNWEPYISVLGDSTFLVGANTFADDGTQLNQRFAVIFQPAAGGAPKLGDEFFADDGTPFRGQINLSRQNGNPERVGGDKRYGAANFISAAETSAGQLPQFQSDNRWTNNPIYQANNRYVTSQPFSLNPATLAQTPLHKAWDFVYGPFATATTPGNQPEVSRTGGTVAGLDNGNFVVVLDDKTGYTAPGEVTTFAIITPTGTVLRTNTLVTAKSIWDNVAAYRGGFAVRGQDTIYFYDNAGNLLGSSPVSSSNLPFGTDRGDSTRIASDVRSHYVYLAGRTPDVPSSPVSVAIWDARTQAFVTSATVSDTDPATYPADRVSVAVDGWDRFTVAYVIRSQIAARVMKFDGTNVSYLTHSFFPFVNNDPTGSLGLVTVSPSVVMTPRQICIAGKGTVNSTNNPTGGPDTKAETTLYTVISHPAPMPAPRPDMTIVTSGINAIITWQWEAGLFRLQTRSALGTGAWADVSPQPAMVEVGDTFEMTVPVGAGDAYFRLVR